MEHVTLNNGVEMPVIGFGVFQIEDQKTCEQCVTDAIKTGYRLIDTAAVYLNEEAVGKAVKRSGIPREDFFITTKVWIKDMGYKKTKEAFERSLARLGIDYIDLYLIHMPFGDVFGTWKAMEELYYEGRARAIGVCNFHLSRLADLIVHHDIKPAVNQIETHLFNQQKAMKEYTDHTGIKIEAWSPFAESQNNFFKNEILTLLANKYNRTVAQIALRWLTQRGIIAIPKSVHKERIEENFHSLNFRLSDDDIALIADCDMAKPVVGNFDNPDFVFDLCTRKYDF